jgi:hypothetical protein
MSTPLRNTSVSTQVSSSITWTGEPIPCLEICTGDNLNTVMYAIAEKVCELAKPFDLSTLTLQCALEIADNEEPANRSLVTIFQLLLDNDCKLKELLDALQAQLDGQSGDSLTLRLGCLSNYYKDNNGVVSLPYTTESILQNLIDELCSLKTTVSGFSGQLSTIKADIIDIREKMPSGNEVTVTTTISGPKAVSLALKDVSKDYTDYKQVLGTTSQIQTALARQTAAMNTLMAGVTGWNATPTTEAQLLSNMMLMFTNLIASAEATRACCAGSCDDIRFGFLTMFEENTVILSFGSGAGTFIPSGYKDNGSTLTISNSTGTSMTVDIVVTQGGETDPIDLSVFTQGDVLTFAVDLKMTNGVDNCQKCINKDVKYVGAGCCVLTASEEVTIMYSTQSSNQIA